MHELSKTILKQYQVRKTKQQKTDFIHLLKTELKGHVFTVEESGLFKSRNIIIGDLENSQYILTAHYDTAPVLPFPNFLAPKNMVAYLGYTLLLLLGFSALSVITSFLVALLTDSPVMIFLVDYALLILILVHMFVGKENKHTANDNTSGVITLIEALHNKHLKDKVCCVFFDHEEVGLFGSSEFAKRHKKQLIDKLLFNFDCVSDGDTIMLIYSKKSKNEKENLEKTFHSKDNKKFLVTPASKTLYPSDQVNFKNYVGVAAFNHHKWIGYYMDRIHTKHDIIFDEQNIDVIIQGLENFVGLKDKTN